MSSAGDFRGRVGFISGNNISIDIHFRSPVDFVRALQSTALVQPFGRAQEEAQTETLRDAK
jgi:hypothetical protein